MRPRDRGARLETVLRLRSPGGPVLAEYTIRGSSVEVVNFFPSGTIADHGTVTLDHFLTEVERMRAQRAAEPSVPEVSLTPENDKGPQTRASEVLTSVEVTEPSTRATGRD